MRLAKEEQVLEAVEVARKAAEAASEKQAIDIVMLDARQVCSFADYFVICTGDSNRQIEAVWQEINKVLKEQGIASHHSEGTAESGWVLLDFGDVVIHIFGIAERDYYQLDRLWDKAVPIVRIQ